MLRVAAEGHRTLTVGQGAELCWARNPQPLTLAEVLDIFRRKTAPAFEVALRLGAALRRRGRRTSPTCSRTYSEALGIAYQIRDDLDDLAEDADAPDDVSALRPSLPLAVAYERAKGEDEAHLERALAARHRRHDPARDARH